MKQLTRTARTLTGLLFIFSGFVKGIDPMGTAFKLGDYFTAFNMSFLDGLTLPLSLLLCMVEFVTGMMLLTGALVKPASWMAALFMALFTPLTLILAFFNPVSDCGCFGDAIILTNWQTFFKNVFITLLVVFVFIRRNDETGVMPVKAGLNFTIAYVFFFLIFMRLNLAYLPALDFRPYKVGTNIAEAMSIPEGAEPDKYDIRFIYEKDGVQQEFTLNDYPANDTTWKFIDQKSVLISRGYMPPIHDFTLINSEGVDMTEHIIRYEGDVVLMVARRLEKSNRDGLMKGFIAGMELQKQGKEFYIVTATVPAEAEPLVKGFNTMYADEITLKTVIRSDPGFLLLHNGTIAAKWSYHSLPDPEEFRGDLNTLAIKSMKEFTGRLIVFITILSIIIAVILALPHTKYSSEANKKQ
ncbi:MAG TPA: DoxX family protein [Bacteroidales bacterium]|nr:DoxX family protein [Bacteroidales bacterium]